ncbi:GIY-YIG nuclease family protein [Aureibaculum sp. 2210JD6-5]|uniref:GIY-YIG nuclease family protein n=1 Tax=Aureibaculum sp. 2210JD6-5 TaxID=3103957 RepID=UPI002AACD416|nr:GIY-YIG nuclease family protein [Aureibaculum sp. 2210JD6-5]MDY7396341.1 GIY-YIG nuclease family protein [Aureibaculum sp. 2210JD6-5]
MLPNKIRNEIVYKNRQCDLFFKSDSFSNDELHSEIEVASFLDDDYEVFRNSDLEYPDFQIYKVLRLDNEFVTKGQPLVVIQKGKPKLYQTVFKKIPIGSPVCAPENGIFKSFIKKGDSIKDGEKLFSIMPLSKDDSNNYCENPIFKYYFNEYDVPAEIRKNIDKIWHPLDKPIYINSWLVKNGEYVTKNTPILEINCGNIVKTYYTYILNSISDGYIEHIKKVDNEFKHSSGIIEQNEHIYTLYKTKTEKYYNKSIIEKDDFTNTKTIKWEVIGGLERPFNVKDYNPIAGIQSISITGESLFFAFQNINGKDFIVFNYFSHEFKLFKGDKISFLFDNEIIINFLIKERTKKLKSNWKLLNEIKIPISIEELETFSNFKLKKWKIELKKTNSIITGDDGNFWYKKVDFQELIQNLSSEYKKIVKIEVDNYQPIQSFNKEIMQINQIDEKCFVYLMVDTTNNYHKIGISNKPEYREKTLQSEKPTIVLLATKEFPIRQIAEAFEKALHDTFANKRIRGEWFELTDNDIKNLMITLEN